MQNTLITLIKNIVDLVDCSTMDIYFKTKSTTFNFSTIEFTPNTLILCDTYNKKTNVIYINNVLLLELNDYVGLLHKLKPSPKLKFIFGVCDRELKINPTHIGVFNDSYILCEGLSTYIIPNTYLDYVTIKTEGSVNIDDYKVTFGK